MIIRRVLGLREHLDEKLERKDSYSLAASYFLSQCIDKMGCCFSSRRSALKTNNISTTITDEALSTDRLLGETGRERNYGAMSCSGDEDDLESEIRKHINNLFKMSTSRSSSAIVLSADMHNLWNRPYIAKFYMRQTWYDRNWDKDNRMSHYRIIMSILVKIRFRKWSSFKSIFMDKENRADAQLPFGKETLKSQDFLEDDGQEFYEVQWMFCPLVIAENAEPQELKDMEEERRFPFVEIEKEIGSGVAGTVYKQVIAVGHLRYQSPGRVSTNSATKTVACKRVQEKQIEDVEFKNMCTLRGFLSTHNRIMVNIATIIRSEQNVGKVHYIFYDLAAYSLKTFLQQAEGTSRVEQYTNDRRRRSDTAPPNRNGSQDWNEVDLISESYHLADALDFLHRGLFKESQYILAHNDLKPENILVFYPDMLDKNVKFPVGQWKIADFGLAKIKKRRRQSMAKTAEHRHRSSLSADPWQTTMEIGDVDITHRRVRSTSKASYHSDDFTKSKRDPGRWSAPEINEEGGLQPDARSGDIWSFGCVLADVLAFAVSPSFVDELKRVCDDDFDQRFYDSKSKKPKQRVIDWLNGLHSRYSSKILTSDWIKGTAHLICNEILLDSPNNRSKAGNIRDRLENIHKTMVNQLKQSPELNTGQHSLHGVSPISPMRSDMSAHTQSPTNVDISISPPFE